MCFQLDQFNPSGKINPSSIENNGEVLQDIFTSKGLDDICDQAKISAALSGIKITMNGQKIDLLMSWILAYYEDNSQSVFAAEMMTRSKIDEFSSLLNRFITKLQQIKTVLPEYTKAITAGRLQSLETTAYQKLFVPNPYNFGNIFQISQYNDIYQLMSRDNYIHTHPAEIGNMMKNDIMADKRGVGISIPSVIQITGFRPKITSIFTNTALDMEKSLFNQSPTTTNGHIQDNIAIIADYIADKPLIDCKALYDKTMEMFFQEANISQIPKHQEVLSWASMNFLRERDHLHKYLGEQISLYVELFLNSMICTPKIVLEFARKGTAFVPEIFRLISVSKAYIEAISNTGLIDFSLEPDKLTEDLFGSQTNYVVLLLTMVLSNKDLNKSIDPKFIITYKMPWKESFTRLVDFLFKYKEIWADCIDNKQATERFTEIINLKIIQQHAAAIIAMLIPENNRLGLQEATVARFTEVLQMYKAEPDFMPNPAFIAILVKIVPKEAQAAVKTTLQVQISVEAKIVTEIIKEEKQLELKEIENSQIEVVVKNGNKADPVPVEKKFTTLVETFTKVDSVEEKIILLMKKNVQGLMKTNKGDSILIKLIEDLAGEEIDARVTFIMIRQLATDFYSNKLTSQERLLLKYFVVAYWKTYMANIKALGGFSNFLLGLYVRNEMYHVSVEAQRMHRRNMISFIYMRPSFEYKGLAYKELVVANKGKRDFLEASTPNLKKLLSQCKKVSRAINRLIGGKLMWKESNSFLAGTSYYRGRGSVLVNLYANDLIINLGEMFSIFDTSSPNQQSINFEKGDLTDNIKKELNFSYPMEEFIRFFTVIYEIILNMQTLDIAPQRKALEAFEEVVQACISYRTNVKEVYQRLTKIKTLKDIEEHQICTKNTANYVSVILYVQLLLTEMGIREFKDIGNYATSFEKEDKSQGMYAGTSEFLALSYAHSSLKIRLDHSCSKAGNNPICVVWRIFTTYESLSNSETLENADEVIKTIGPELIKIMQTSKFAVLEAALVLVEVNPKSIQQIERAFDVLTEYTAKQNEQVEVASEVEGVNIKDLVKPNTLQELLKFKKADVHDLAIFLFVRFKVEVEFLGELVYMEVLREYLNKGGNPTEAFMDLCKYNNEIYYPSLLLYTLPYLADYKYYMAIAEAFIEIGVDVYSLIYTKNMYTKTIDEIMDKIFSTTGPNQARSTKVKGATFPQLQKMVNEGVVKLIAEFEVFKKSKFDIVEDEVAARHTSSIALHEENEELRKKGQEPGEAMDFVEEILSQEFKAAEDSENACEEDLVSKYKSENVSAGDSKMIMDDIAKAAEENAAEPAKITEATDPQPDDKAEESAEEKATIDANKSVSGALNNLSGKVDTIIASDPAKITVNAGEEEQMENPADNNNGITDNGETKNSPEEKEVLESDQTIVEDADKMGEKVLEIIDKEATEAAKKDTEITAHTVDITSEDLNGGQKTSVKIDGALLTIEEQDEQLQKNGLGEDVKEDIKAIENDEKISSNLAETSQVQETMDQEEKINEDEEKLEADENKEIEKIEDEANLSDENNKEIQEKEENEKTNEVKTEGTEENSRTSLLLRV